MLTTKKIKFISYDSINNNAFVGDYRISGSKTNIDKFVNRLNSGKAQIQAKLIKDQLREIRSMAIVNTIAFLLALIILAAIIKLDLETYFIEHGRRIDVSRLFGYNFFGIHSGKIYSDYYIYLASVIIYVGLIIVSEKMVNADLFRPIEGWGSRSIGVCFGVAIISMIVTHVFELIGLKRGDKEIVTRLKE